MQNKKSDVLFILGSGSSINDVTDDEWEIVRQHDSLAFNYFLFHPFVPTYFHFEYNRDPEIRKNQTDLFERRKKDYENTTIIVHSRALKRGMHHRILSRWFPDNPAVCYYKFPKIVACPKTRPLVKEDFNGRYMYKGSLNLMFYLGYRMGYKKIVLLGCEMNYGVGFYEDIKEAQWAVNSIYVSKEKRKNLQYLGTYDDGKHSQDKLVYAFNDFVLSPNSIELYVARKESVLYPKIPYLDISTLDKGTCGVEMTVAGQR